MHATTLHLHAINPSKQLQLIR